jgi:hypothetical protein
MPALAMLLRLAAGNSAVLAGEGTGPGGLPPCAGIVPSKAGPRGRSPGYMRGAGAPSCIMLGKGALEGPGPDACRNFCAALELYSC